MNKIISYGWGIDLPIGLFVDNIHKMLMRGASREFKNIVLIDTTWVGSANINAIHDQIRNCKPDLIILCSFVDATFVDATDFKQFGIKIISIGNFNQTNRIDFWSIVINDRYVRSNTTPGQFIYPFISYNNKPHPHRLALRNDLSRLKLLDNGAVSFGGDNPILSPENRSKIAYENSGGGNELLNDTMTLGDIDVWNASFVNIITETEFDPVDRVFYSEKTWKPMIGMRPFLHYTSGDVNHELRTFGFETFENSFGDICDLDLNIHTNIALFCELLSKQNNKYFLKKYGELLPAIKHNYTHFFEFANTQHKKLENIYY